MYSFVFALCSYALSIPLFSVVLAPHFPVRHLQRELENQRAQETRFQQQMKKLDEDIKQNEGLLRRAHMGQKSTKVTIFPSLSLTVLCKVLIRLDTPRLVILSNYE